MAQRKVEYLSQFARALSKRGVGESKVASFVKQWESLSQEDPNVPCPFCFARGGKGALEEQTEIGGILAMR